MRWVERVKIGHLDRLEDDPMVPLSEVKGFDTSHNIYTLRNHLFPRNN